MFYKAAKVACSFLVQSFEISPSILVKSRCLLFYTFLLRYICSMWFHSIPMEDLKSNDAQFQRRGEGIRHCSSSEMNANPNPMPEKISGLSAGTVSLYKSSMGSSGESLFSSGWDSFANLGQRENFGSFISHDELSSSYQHNMLENPHSFDSTYVEMVPKFPTFSSCNFSEMGSSFALPQYLQIVNDDCLSNIKKHTAAGLSPSDKSRKRGPDTASSLGSYEKAETDLGKDSNGESSDGLREQDQKKPKIDDNNGGNLLNKPSVKQGKDNSPKAETSKENYIHVRARRGEATNSHSLAERIRREKISERMKLLQELVPGCNKITGKAVMLDEIINYVQSLQQQVEFLSMKLATVNPEIYPDIEDILSKDVLHSQGSNGEILGVGPSQRFFPLRKLPPQTALSRFLPLSRVSLGSSNGAIAATFPSSAALTEDKFQTVLQNEFQIHFPMGLDSG